MQFPCYIYPRQKLRIMKKLYFLGLTFLWGITLAGQVTLNWQVTDDENRPLARVSVWNKGAMKGVITDANGRFSMIVNPGKDVLELSFLGYEKVEIKTHPGMKLNGNEMLFPIQYELDEITIRDLAIEKTTVEYEVGCTLYKSVTSDIKISINDIRSATKIFPVPTQNSVFIQQDLGLGQVDLYNASGQKLQSFNFNDQLNASIDLSNLPSGTYFLRSNKGWTDKVILQKQ